MSKKKLFDLRTLTAVGMLAAVAYAVTAACHFLIPIRISGFLSIDLKDCLLVIGGFMYHPVIGIILAALVSLLEMITFSGTGPIGFLMNLLSSSLFVGVAALIYHRKRTMSGAVTGLLAGVLATAAGMLLWNWLVTPWYMHVDRAVVEGMLLPVILPFNLLKGGINATLSLLLYRPLTSALRSARLLPPAVSGKARGTTLAVVFIAGFLLATLTLVFLVWGGVL